MKALREWLPLMAAVVGLLVGVKLFVANPIESRFDRIEDRLGARLDRIETEVAAIQERLDEADRQAQRADPQSAFHSIRSQRNM